MTHQIRNILHDQETGSMVGKNLHNIIDQVAVLRTLQAKLFSGFREVLTGEACAENVVRRNLLGFE